MSGIRLYEGKFDHVGRVAIVAARFNHAIVDKLMQGALDALRRHGVSDQQISIARTPGAWEIPLVCRKLALKKKYNVLIALGAVIRGDTPHFEAVVSETVSGCSRVMQDTDVPVIFGVLTTNTVEQAWDRAGGKMGNKGWDAAMAALEMASLLGSLDA